MENVYCVKDERHTPNVPESEKVVTERAVEYSVTLLWQLVILKLQKEFHILRKKVLKLEDITLLKQ